MTEKFDIQNFDSSRDFCIEASAGTGKTYTIRKIVSKLVETGIPLSKILLVTYTEKAAGELRDRIRKEMLENKGPAFERALSEVDNAPIGTIHSFCQKTLRDFAYEADVPFAMGMVGEDAVADLINRFLRDEWADEIAKSNLNANDVCAKMISAIKAFAEGMEVPAVKHWKVLQEHSGEKYFAVARKGAKQESEYTVAGLMGFIRAGNVTKTNSGSVFGHADSPEIEKAIRYFTEEGGEMKDESLFVFSHLPDVFRRFQQQKREDKLQSFSDMILQVRDAVVSPDGSVTPLCRKLRSAYRYAIIDEFQDTNQDQWDIFKTVFLESPLNNIIVVGDPKQSIYSFQGADLDVYFSARDEIAQKGERCVLDTNFRSTDAMVCACNEMFSGSFFDGNRLEFEPSNPCGDIKVPLWNGETLKPIQAAENVNAETFAKYAVSRIVEFVSMQNGKTALQIFDKGKGDYANLKLSNIAVLAKSRSEMENIESMMAWVGIPFVRYKDSNLFNGRESGQWIALFKTLNAPDFTGRNRGVLNAVLVSDFFRIPLEKVENDVFENPNSKIASLFVKWRSLVKRKRFAELQESVYAETQIDRYLCDSSKLQSLAKFKQVGAYAFDYLINHRATLEELVKHLEGLSVSVEDTDDEDGNLVSRGSDFDAVQVMTIHASKGLQFPVVVSVAGFTGLNNRAPGPFVCKTESGKIIRLDEKARTARQEEEVEEWRRLFYVDYTRAESVLLLPFAAKPKKKLEFLAKMQGTISADYMEKDNRWTVESARENWHPLELKKKVNEFLNASRQESDNTDYPNVRQFMQSLNDKSIFQHSYSSLAGKIREGEDAVTTENGKLLNRQALDEAESRGAVKTAPVDPNPVRILPEDSRPISETSLSDGKKVKDFPRGCKLGNALHQIFELMDFEKIGKMEKVEAAVQDAEFRKLIEEQFKSQAFAIEEHPDWVDLSAHFAWNTMNANLPEICGNKPTDKYFSLKELPAENRRAEMAFQMNALGFGENPLRNFCKGFMDLLFVRGEYYSILDWKSDVLENYGVGDSTVSGTMKKVDDEYAVQRVLYSYSLVQWLKSFGKFGADEEEIFQKHFGGVYYVFFRECRSEKSSGIYAQTWENYAALSAAFEKVKNLMTRKS